MTPLLIGYFPKRTVPPPEGLLAAHTVTALASVSTCLAPGPADWVHAWLHNTYWVFDSPARAWRVVPAAQRDAFDLYAYKQCPVAFVHGKAQDEPIAAPGVVPLDATFVRLGYDVVSRSGGTAFECSPLSCNGLANEVPVNPCCLVDALPDALRLAQTVEQAGGEPGPYYVVEVWRQAAS